VPKLLGKTLGRARRLLAARHCRLGRVGRAYSSKVRKGRIVKQSQRAGARLARGAKVNVTLSRGPRRK
jgi:beta-lactam-binding protein with PASTA domain